MATNDNLLFEAPAYTLWAQVLLPLAVPTVYTYAIPNEMLSTAIKGCRVEVVFGKTKKYAGIINHSATNHRLTLPNQLLMYWTMSLCCIMNSLHCGSG